jgi:glycosyltransferase involved in cell wall biosynthesis
MNKKLSIIVPVYNEVETVLILLNKLIKLNLYNNFNSEIIIVDDNSTDGTKELLKNLEKETSNTNLKFIYKSKNSGKGSSQKLAIPLCNGDFTIIQDADLEYNVNNINSLLKLMVDYNYDAVLGYRKLANTKIYSAYFFFHKLAIFTLTFLTNILYGSNFKDVCTCYRMIKTPILKNFKINGERFEYDFSMINQLAKHTRNVGLVEIEYNNRSFKEGKKNTWIVGLYAIKRIILDRFNI